MGAARIPVPTGRGGCSASCPRGRAQSPLAHERTQRAPALFAKAAPTRPARRASGCAAHAGRCTAALVGPNTLKPEQGPREGRGRKGLVLRRGERGVGMARRARVAHSGHRQPRRRQERERDRPAQARGVRTLQAHRGPVKHLAADRKGTARAALPGCVLHTARMSCIRQAAPPPHNSIHLPLNTLHLPHRVWHKQLRNTRPALPDAPRRQPRSTGAAVAPTPRRASRGAHKAHASRSHARRSTSHATAACFGLAFSLIFQGLAMGLAKPKIG